MMSPLEKLLNGLHIPISSTSVKHYRHSTLYFTYTSPPQPVQFPVRNRRYRNNIIRPRGVHDYFNLMWDPHIVRGSTFKLQTGFLERHDDDKGIDKTEGPEQPKTGRKKRSTNIFSRKISKKSEGNKYEFTTPPPLNGRIHSTIQTERQFLEDLGATDINSISLDVSVQTEAEYDLEHPIKRPSLILAKAGTDVGTQILPNELFDFDAEVEPILESLVGKVLEQALFEVLEEEETFAIREQRNRFLDIRRQEERELKDLLEQKERIYAEKERLKLEIEKEGPFWLANNSEESPSSLYSSSYIIELLPSVLKSLRQEVPFEMSEVSSQPDFQKENPTMNCLDTDNSLGKVTDEVDDEAESQAVPEEVAVVEEDLEKAVERKEATYVETYYDADFQELIEDTPTLKQNPEDFDPNELAYAVSVEEIYDEAPFPRVIVEVDPKIEQNEDITTNLLEGISDTATKEINIEQELVVKEIDERNEGALKDIEEENEGKEDAQVGNVDVSFITEEDLQNSAIDAVTVEETNLGNLDCVQDNPELALVNKSAEDSTTVEEIDAIDEMDDSIENLVPSTTLIKEEIEHIIEKAESTEERLSSLKSVDSEDGYDEDRHSGANGNTSSENIIPNGHCTTRHQD